MKTLVALTLAIGMASPAMADGANPYDKIGADNPAFEPSGSGSIQNKNNNGLRFGSGGRVVIPGNGATNANENSAVSEHSTGEAIVAPRGRN